jgi:cell division protein FtsL
MSRRILILLVIAVPLLLFANVLQAFRYSRLEREISRLEQEQLALIEENKRAILAISVLSSPQRVGPLAVDELGLERIDEEEIIRMRLEAPGAAQ